ncbi:hypothetical protein [Pedobacter panaciterrae]
MNVRNLLMTSVFAIAIALSFTLKANKKDLTHVTYHPYNNSSLCLDGDIGGVPCSTIVSSLQCTITDPSSGMNVPTYARGDDATQVCLYPLYVRF